MNRFNDKKIAIREMSIFNYFSDISYNYSMNSLQAIIKVFESWTIQREVIIWLGKVMSLKDFAVFWAQFLEALICVFEENWIYRPLYIFLLTKFFVNLSDLLNY